MRPKVLGSSSKTILAKSVNDDEVQEGEVTASSEVDSAFEDYKARSAAYDQAIESFKSLDANQKTQRRKSAVSNVIAGSEVSVDDEIALQQPWESNWSGGARLPAQEETRER